MAPSITVLYAHGMADDEKEASLSLNQLVAARIAFYRQAAGMTQKELGARLGWSNVSVSEAERSRDGRRVREFDAADLGAIAWALGIPVIALLLPLAEEEGHPQGYQAGPAVFGAADLLALLVMPDSDDDTPAMEAYRDEFNRAADRWLEPEWAARAVRWLREGAAPDARADDAARLRRWARQQRESAERLDEFAAAIDKDAP